MQNWGGYCILLNSRILLIEVQNLYSNCPMSERLLSKTVLTNGVGIWAIRTVM